MLAGPGSEPLQEGRQWRAFSTPSPTPNPASLLEIAIVFAFKDESHSAFRHSFIFPSYSPCTSLLLMYCLCLLLFAHYPLPTLLGLTLVWGYTVRARASSSCVPCISGRSTYEHGRVPFNIVSRLVWLLIDFRRKFCGMLPCGDTQAQLL